MTTDEARKIQAEVMRLAQTFRKRDGQPQLTSNNVHEAYFVMYNNLDTGYNKLSEWKRDVIRTSMGSNSRSMKKGFLLRYVELAMRRDFLPDDEILEEAWGTGNGTFSSIRNRLRKRGFDFEGSVGKSWKVTARPQPEPEPEPEPEPVKPPSLRAILEERGETPMVMLSPLPEVDSMVKLVHDRLVLAHEPEALSAVPSRVDIPTPIITLQLDAIIKLLSALLDVWTR